MQSANDGSVPGPRTGIRHHCGDDAIRHCCADILLPLVANKRRSCKDHGESPQVAVPSILTAPRFRLLMGPIMYILIYMSGRNEECDRGQTAAMDPCQGRYRPGRCQFGGC